MIKTHATWLMQHVTPQSGNQVSTSLSNSGLCWTVFARNRDTAVPAEGNGDLQTLICVLVARPRRCLTLSNPVPWQNWMAAYLGCTLRMRMLFRGWPIMVNDMHTRRRRTKKFVNMFSSLSWPRVRENTGWPQKKQSQSLFRIAPSNDNYRKCSNFLHRI